MLGYFLVNFTKFFSDRVGINCFFFSYYSSKVDVINMMSNSNGLNITNVNNKNLRENQQQLANDLSKQTTNKSTLSTSVSSSSECFLDHNVFIL